MQAGIISEKLGIPPATLSFHLSQLYKAGLVKFRREGRSIYYSVDYDKTQNLISYLSENFSPHKERAALSSRTRRKNGR